MPSTFFHPGSNKDGIGRCIFRPLRSVPSLVAIQTGGNDVLLFIAPSVTPRLQMLCGATEEQDGPTRYSKACSENVGVAFPHGRVAVVASPPLAVGCLASQISYSVACSHESTSFASLLKRTCSGPKGRPSVGRIFLAPDDAYMRHSAVFERYERLDYAQR